jgi:hypothetical protein
VADFGISFAVSAAMMVVSYGIRALVGTSTKPLSSTDPVAAGYRVTTSVEGLAIALLYGTNRVPGNMIWYGDYQAIPHTTTQSSGGSTGGKGMGGGDQTTSHTSYTYQASFAIGLCHGPVIRILKAWGGKDVVDLYPEDPDEKASVISENSAWSIFLGTYSQAAWSYLTSLHPTEAVRYPYLVYVAAANYSMGDSPVLPNFSFLIEGFNNTYYTTEVAETVVAAADVTVEHANQYVSNVSVEYSGGATLDQVESSPNVGQYSQDGDGVYHFNTGDFGLSMVITYNYGSPAGARPDEIIQDIFTNTFYGLGIDAAKIDATSFADYRLYCQENGLILSPTLTSQMVAKDFVSQMLELTNSQIIQSGGKFKIIPYGDETVGTWVPNLTPVYTLDYDHLIDKDDSTIIVERTSSADAYNIVTLQINDAGKDYNNVPVEYPDQADVEDYGPRPLPSITAQGITSKSLALRVAKLISKRLINSRNKITFALPWNYCLLEPMDIISITSESLGYDEQLCRIISVVEDEEGKLEIEAEEMSIGIGHSTADVIPDSTGYNPATMVNPGDANTPIIFVPPISLTTVPQVWLVTSGGVNWGGCHIWISEDNSTYVFAGSMVGGCRYGTLTADLPLSLVSPDITNTLSVDLTESKGSLSSGTTAEAESLRTLCYVDGEYLAYRDSSLTAPYLYDLDYLVRGQYETTMDLHLTGSYFIRLDGSVFKFIFDLADVGKTIYIKLQSYNNYMRRPQALSDLSAYTYVVQSPGDEIITLGSPW